MASPKLDELLSLHGKALFEAASEYGALDDFSTQDLLKTLRLLEKERESISDHDIESSALTETFKKACEKANNQELDQLIALYLRIDADTLEKHIDFQPLAARWIKREIEKPRELKRIKVEKDTRSV